MVSENSVADVARVEREMKKILNAEHFALIAHNKRELYRNVNKRVKS